MSTVKIQNLNKIYLNSFRPLCMTPLGKLATTKHGHPPFIDASCRREPDFEHATPTISAICRQGMFAPRLRENDLVVYMTVKRRYGSDKSPSNRLIAILQVDWVFPTHQHGKEWFEAEGMALPSNCMVKGNEPYPFDHTAGNFEKALDLRAFMKRDTERQQKVGARRVVHWDNNYKYKADNWSMLIKTKPLYIEVNDPVPLHKETLLEIFGGKVPNTRNPKAISLRQLADLAFLAGVSIAG
ncbi:hypothetical protein [Rufibacter latericius]|uniref:Nucleotide modification associated domain-containing protein n=1 Tax=Rufibacter latericius TaxID=2487040 RepID=A0A3M9MBX7_9BACT|nr:hypothetical protein [Rufibacter latericius]RNI22657.1 hypothetical protein EFB08_21425 [Rufibacter latericius]